MRVLIDYRPALRARTGVGEYVHELVRALLRVAGRPDVTLFTSSWKDRPQVDALAELPGAHVVDRRVPVQLLNLAWHRLGWPSVELLARGRFDVTHSLHPLLMPTRRGATMVTVHDLDFLEHPERLRAEIRRDYPALAAAHARRADAIAVPSQYTSGKVQHLLGIDASRIVICSPGTPRWARPSGNREEARRRGYLLFMGSLDPRKNIPGLLEAYSLLAGRRRDLPDLVLAGPAGPGAEPWLASLARPPLAGRARHLGYVQPAERPSVYAGARLLVLPSFDEGFGIPVLEAMAQAVPVVASNRGALPEVLGNAGTLVDPDDHDALAAAIERLLDDDEFAKECERRGLDRAAQFTWTRSATAVCETYRAITGQRQG